jgi:carbon storage regulator CsrA
MLVLSRRVGERIWIAPDTILVVTEIRPGQVRLGFEAPRSVKIGRLPANDVPVRRDE